MKKLPFIPVLFLAFYTAFSPASPVNDNPVELECARLVSQMNGPMRNYLEQNLDIYGEMRRRILQHGGVNETKLDRFIIKLVQTFDLHQDRIVGSRRFDGDFVARNFLRGVTLWVESFSDLENAVEVFSHFQPKQRRRAGDPDEDLDLEHFAARMTWLAYAYDSRNPSRQRALEHLDDFDGTCSIEMGITTCQESLRVMIAKANRSTLSRLLDSGLQPPLAPITDANLEFNNGRLFHFFELERSKAPEFWAARMFHRERPQELILALDDTSTRSFYRIFRVVQGWVHRFPRAADFIHLEEKKPGKYGVRFRELKFASPSTYTVDVADALEQLRSTWEGWVDAYGTAIPVYSLEVVVPRRNREHNGGLGKGYHMGPSIEYPDSGRSRPMINPLLLHNKPVTLEVGGRSLAVWLRQLDITQAWYDELAKDKKSSK